MRGRSFGALLAALGGCYEPSALEPCALTCSGADPCPDNLVCGADQRCHGADDDTCAVVGGLFRSVGAAMTTPLATGSGNALVVHGRTATFGQPLPDRIGVGDALQYDTNGDGAVDTVVFVHERLSSTDLVVESETGAVAMPTNGDESWSIYRAYTSLHDAARGVPNTAISIGFDTWTSAPDLTALGKSWNIACYADGVDRGTVHFEGWQTSETAYLRIFTPTGSYEVGASQRHAGVWDTSRYALETPGLGSDDFAIEIVDMFARVDGLQIYVNTDGASSDQPYGISFTNLGPTKQVFVSNTILHSSDIPNANTKARGIRADAAALGPTLYAWNNVIYDFGGMTEARGIELTGAGTTAVLFANTIANVFPAIFGNSTSDSFLIKNTLVLACDQPCLGNRGAFRGSNNVGMDFDSRGIGSATKSDVVTDYVRSAGDLHLNPQATYAGDVIGLGDDLGSDADLAFDRDIDGEPRGDVWDIGADQH